MNHSENKNKKCPLLAPPSKGELPFAHLQNVVFLIPITATGQYRVGSNDVAAKGLQRAFQKVTYVFQSGPFYSGKTLLGVPLAGRYLLLWMLLLLLIDCFFWRKKCLSLFRPTPGQVCRRAAGLQEALEAQWGGGDAKGTPKRRQHYTKRL